MEPATRTPGERETEREREGIILLEGQEGEESATAYRRTDQTALLTPGLFTLLWRPQKLLFPDSPKRGARTNGRPDKRFAPRVGTGGGQFPSARSWGSLLSADRTPAPLNSGLTSRLLAESLTGRLHTRSR